MLERPFSQLRVRGIRNSLSRDFESFLSFDQASINSCNIQENEKFIVSFKMLPKIFET